MIPQVEFLVMCCFLDVGYCLFAIFEIEPKPLHVLGKLSTTEPWPQYSPSEFCLFFTTPYLLHVAPCLISTRSQSQPHGHSSI